MWSRLIRFQGFIISGEVIKLGRGCSWGIRLEGGHADTHEYIEQILENFQE